MHRLSDRALGLTPAAEAAQDPDDGWGLFYRARALEAAGREVFNLTIGEPDQGTDRAILDKMHDAACAGHTGYAAVPGTLRLRTAVAARLSKTTGRVFGPENVLITPGAQAALFAAHTVLCDPGDAALLIDPYYTTYPGTIRGAGARPVPVTARSEDGFQPRAEAVEHAARQSAARTLLINTPNNPTGAVYTRETLESLTQVALRHDLWLISDEVYDSQVWRGHHVSPAGLPGMFERVLTVGSLSKSHAMTGSRIGWIAGPEAVIDHLINLATHTTYGVPGFIQEAGAHALGLGPDYEARRAAPFRRRRARLLDALQGHALIRASAPDGAMYVMLDIRATGLSGAAFGAALLEQTGVAVMPGESFGHGAAGHLRVALTLPGARFDEAVARLMRFANGIGSA